jgi:ribosomal protein S21
MRIKQHREEIKITVAIGNIIIIRIHIVMMPFHSHRIAAFSVIEFGLKSPLTFASFPSHRIRSLYTKVQLSASHALDKLQLKAEREGIDKMLKERARYMKPKYERQKNVKDAVYNTARRQRDKFIKEMLEDPRKLM